VPDQPAVFTKYVTAPTGPCGDIQPLDGDVDWEVDLVAVIGRRAYQVSEAAGRSPARYLAAGNELVSYIDGIGRMRLRFVAAPVAGQE
jgi:2,4-didehydro-3-deoxy-L-rhamnonate hydrolase